MTSKPVVGRVSVALGQKMTLVSVQGVKSLGGHFACLCRGFDFYEVKKNIIIFQKEKGNTFTLLIILYTVKSSKISKIAQIYTYDPQSAVINVQSPPK